MNSKINYKVPHLKDEFELYPHQKRAVKWMRAIEALSIVRSSHGIRGGILALELGLGKTLVSIAHALMKQSKTNPILVVCTKTLMWEWKNQLQKFFGDNIKVLYFHSELIGKPHFLNISKKEFKEYDVVVTTYDVVRGECSKKHHDSRWRILGESGRGIGMREATGVEKSKENPYGPALLFKLHFPTIISDESQKFNNHKTALFRSMMSMEADFKWCLSGTPIRNRDKDLFALLRWCGYNGASTVYEWSSILINNHHLTNYILSMDYKDAEIQLPDLHTQEIEVKFTKNESRAYEYYENGAKQAFRNYMLGGVNYATILAILTRLRQVCTASYLVCGESKRGFQGKTRDQMTDEKKSMRELDKIMNGLASWIKDKNGESGKCSSKIRALIDLLISIPKDEKVLVFSIFTSTIDLITEALGEEQPEMRFCVVDGSVKGRERDETLKKFKTEDIQIMFATYGVCGEGLNLIEASRVVCLESWWTFAVPKQAIGRAHRLNQKRDVIVYKFIIKGTIEERMWEMCDQKQEMADGIVKGGKMNHLSIGKILGIY